MSVFLYHILAEIYGFNRFWEEGQVKPLDTVVGEAQILELAKNKEHFVDILQVVVIKSQRF